jgi:UDP-4-amino-4,6-dideoxy-N-acetyl-beta-L-altrosamine transaminase
MEQVMSEPFLPYGRQFIDAADVAAVTAALQSDYLTTGPQVAAFEAAFAMRVGAKYAVVSANGTTALHLAAAAAGLQVGDVAVVPTLTFLSTANAVRFCGADVVFADCDPDTALTGAGHIEAALKAAAGKVGKVKAAFVVHMNGQACDMEAVGTLAKARGLKVIEDASHAIGTTYTDKAGAVHPVGACRHSDFVTFSLHPLKTLTMGEGGITTTNDPVAYELMCRLRTHGMVRDPGRFEVMEQGFDAGGTANPWYYEMPEIGFNYRATDVQCALGLSQLAKLDWFAERRADIVKRYDTAFLDGKAGAGHNRRFVPFTRRAGSTNVLHLYVLLIDYAALGKSRARVMAELKTQGVGTQVHYLPVHRQPYYTRLYGDQTFPGADSYYARCLSIPLYPGMTPADTTRVITAIRQTTGAAT